MTLVLQTPSLQHLARMKIVAQLWNQRPIFTQIAKLVISTLDRMQITKSEEWKSIEKKVWQNALKLSLTVPCENLLHNLIQPLGLEILNWCEYHYEINTGFVYLDKLPKQLCWTFLGTVDYKKTAELMVKDKTLELEKRYALACVNCLEDEIRDLIKYIPEIRRKELISELRSVREMDHGDLIVFWTCSISGETDQLNGFIAERSFFKYSPHQFAFHCALYCGNRAASAYFLVQLNQEEKYRVIKRFRMPFRRNLNIIAFYLWWQMSEGQRERLFRSCSAIYLLDCMLCWPCQFLFIETAKRQQSFMKKDDYIWLLGVITRKIFSGFKDYDYSELFREFWQLSPADARNYYLDSGYHVEEFFRTGDDELVKLILDEASGIQLERLVRFGGQKVMRILTDKRVVSRQTLNECKRKIELECENEPDQDIRSKCGSILRILTVLIESRNRKEKHVLGFLPLTQLNNKK